MTTDVPSLVINGKNGYVRSNQSWILGRWLRDYETKYWMRSEVEFKLQELLKAEGRAKAGLCISLFTASSDEEMPKNTQKLEKGDEPAVEPQWDALWMLGYVVALLQVGIAAIPWALWDQWQVFLLTACGTVLSLSAGSMAQ